MTARRVVPAGILVLAALLRFAGLGSPPQLMFDETHYARDACTYVSSDGCGIDHEENLEHPPLGKWLIAFGITVAGNDAFGWRIMSAIAGSISVLLLYLLALRVSGSLVTAVLAAALMALDPLHLVQSRMAMLDVFALAFGLAALLCAYLARASGSRWWLLGLAVSGGAATACKWSGVVFLLLAVLVYLHGRPFVGIEVALVVVVAFSVYAASFIERVDNIPGFFSLHSDMWSFHSGLDYQHPYAAPPWDWLMLKRPVAFLFGTTADGKVAEVLGTGNPLLWWPAVAALIFCMVAWVRERATPEMRLAVVGFSATFGIWLAFSPFRSAMFLFYMVPVLPFLYLAFASVAAKWQPGPLIAAGIAVVSLLFWWPVLTGEPIDRGPWHRRLLFEDCSAPGRTPQEIATPLIRATPGGAPPPTGWCWI